MRVVFLSLMYNKEDEKELNNKVKGMLQFAGNTFQYALLDGFKQNDYIDKVFIINSYPIGVYGKDINQLVFKKTDFVYDGQKIGVNIPFINLHIIKQHIRYKNTYKILKKYVKNHINEEIKMIAYDLYAPYIKALYKIKKKYNNVSICPIVTDMRGKNGILPQNVLKRKYLILTGEKMLKRLKNFDKFILLTDGMAKSMNLNENQYLVVEGIFSENDKINNTENLTTSNKKIVLYTGTLDPHYGILTLIDAFKLIKNTEYELWIAGGNGQEKEVYELAKEDSRIKFFGSVLREKAIAMQKGADLLINPRPNEGEYVKYSFPSKTMEYLASGKPVLMYKLYGIPNEYDEFLNYIPEQNLKSMAKCIEDILQDDTNKYIMRAKKGKDFILSEKTAQKQVNKIINFIEK